MIVTVGQADVLTNTFVKSNYNNYNVSCNGYEDGIIDATTNGGVGPYVYNWTGLTALHLRMKTSRILQQVLIT